MVSISVLFIAIVGTAHFRYYAALGSRKAVMHSTAARIAVMLSESWQAIQGDESYDPVDHFSSDLNIEQITVGEIEYDETFTLLGSYVIVLNNTSYNAILLWKDVSAGLRALNIIVSWSQLGGKETGNNKSFKLTTYTILTE